MNILIDRLAKGAAVLEQLEQRRLETGTPRWGYATEYEIVNRELRELAADILLHPGALEPQVVRVRRKR